ncbi:hypothetical protein KP509_23G053100 [Ceratopteris richardii]|uniref:GDSL esterase/lipase n=1 Tax=Ceratopteris richardii TaxID=49495 RepID=A0A8T2S1Q8_CERRI|nr:hypothetical protein KP509_23G053100 [Ceratopteris richardii]
MAVCVATTPASWFSLLLLAACYSLCSCVHADGKNVKSLFVFGDSYADTGNRDPLDESLNIFWKKPYGSTWPGHPTGRASNGRVFTDFFAAHIGVKTPPAYRVVQDEVKMHPKLRHLRSSIAGGVNFAYAGSGIFPTFGPKIPTISAQIDQFRAILRERSVCISDSSTALLVVAGNDYTIYGLSPKNESLANFTGRVVSGIIDSLKALHKLGFNKLAVTNLEPFGCFPAATAPSNYRICNETSTQESRLHNKLLASRIRGLKPILPKADITILDLDRAFSHALQGYFKHSRYQWKSCCQQKENGQCGAVDAKGNALYSVCPDPNEAFFWDTVHPTDSGWNSVAKILFS